MMIKNIVYSIFSVVLLSSCVNNTPKAANEANDEAAVKYLYPKTAQVTVGEAPLKPGNLVELKATTTLKWKDEICSTDKYDVYLTADVQSSVDDLKLNFTCGDDMYVISAQKTKGPWVSGGRNVEQKLVLEGVFIDKGINEFTVSTPKVASDEVLLTFRSIKLVPSSLKELIAKDDARALASRASVKWMNESKYGLMFHWTTQTVSQNGEILPYEQAVDNFDVDKFAKMVKETGAAYVIFTIGHAEQYCPAPIASWEKVHPGQTTKRDLIMEMADALAKENVKLMCYMHSMGTAKLGEGSNQAFFDRFKSILTEFGERYGEKLAGYWFDCWYQIFEAYPDVPFEEFYNATKIGNKDRVVCLNSWIYPAVTPWQDYWAGEVTSPVALPVNGTYNDGPAVGLPHQSLLIMEPYWVQEKAEMPTPRFTSDKLAKYINDCAVNGGIVTINMGIYQDGEVGKEALQVMREVKNLTH